MKRLTFALLVSVASVFGSGFFFPLSFDERCQRSDIIVRAINTRTVNLLTDDEAISGQATPQATAVQVFRVVSIAKGDPQKIPPFIYITSNRGQFVTRGDEIPDFPINADVVLFAQDRGEGFYSLLDSLAFEELRDGKVVPVNARINRPKSDQEWQDAMKDAESFESIALRIQAKK